MCLSYRELTNKELIVRKNHMCEWCSETIYQGQTARYRSYVLDGEVTSGHMHTECYDAMKGSDSKAICEGWMPGDWERGVRATWSDMP